MSETFQGSYITSRPSTEIQVPETATHSGAAGSGSSWEAPDHESASARIVLCVFPAFQLTMGIWHHDHCPRQRYILIYLEVMGGYTLALLFLSLCYKPLVINRKLLRRALNTVTSLFFFCWFITGNVWIYSIYEPNYNKLTSHLDPYCDKTLYLFAFWTTNMTYILTGLLCCCCCCCVACMRPSVMTTPT